MPRSMPIFMRWWKQSLLRGARSWRRGPGTCARCSHTPGERGAHRGSSVVAVGGERGEDQRGAGPQVADLDVRAVERRRARRSWRGAVSTMSIRAPIRRSSRQPLEAVLEDRLVDVRGARSPGSAGRDVGGWRSVARPGYGAVSMSHGRKPPVAQAVAVDLDRCPARTTTATPARSRTSRSAPRWSHGAPVERDPAAGHRAGDDERAGLDPVGDHPVLGAAQAACGPRPRSCRGRSARPRRPSSGGTR